MTQNNTDNIDLTVQENFDAIVEAGRQVVLDFRSLGRKDPAARAHLVELFQAMGEPETMAVKMADAAVAQAQA